MSGVGCCICRESLKNAPYGIETLGAPDPMTTSCGHLFHRHCLQDFWGIARNHGLCPFCGNKLDPSTGKTVRLYFNVETDEINDLNAAISDLTLENEDLKERIKTDEEVISQQAAIIEHQEQEITDLEHQIAILDPEAGPGGARFVMPELEYPDATCFNCESPDHETVDCDENVIVRFLDSTKSDKYCPITTFTLMGELHGHIAGEIVQFVSRIAGWDGGPLNRREVQMCYAYYFFGEACRNCSSPYHETHVCVIPPIPIAEKERLDRFTRDLVFSKV